MIKVSASATIVGGPEQAAAAILSPAALPRWFSGAKQVTVGGPWPAMGSTMSWQVGGLRFDATVVENALPAFLRMQVRTPSADSTITHRFDVEAGGRVRYEKIIEAQPRGLGSKLFAPLLKMFLGSSVKKEVERAATLAAGAPPS